MKNQIRNRLYTLLGFDIAPKPDVQFQTQSIIHDKQFDIEKLTIHSGDIGVPATFLRPHAPRKNNPAVLYCHAHGNNYKIGKNEILQGRPALQPTPYGPILAQLGFEVLCMDMPCFGERQSEGSEANLARAALWQGRTMFGQMLAELSTGLDYLTYNSPDRQKQITTLGISMGATHAYWLAALDDRVTAVAHMCAFSNIQGLIDTDTHLLHGPYMTIPGLLSQFDMADIAALIAPRPQLVASGLKDPLTPPEALNPALQKLQNAYQAAPNKLTIINDNMSGHEETAQMRKAILDFLVKTI